MRPRALAVRRMPGNNFFYGLNLLFERTFEEGGLIYKLSDMQFNRLLCFQ